MQILFSTPLKYLNNKGAKLKGVTLMEENIECPVCNGYGEYILYYSVRTYSNNSYFNTKLHKCEFCKGKGKLTPEDNIKTMAEKYKSQVVQENTASYLRCFKPEEASFHQWYKGWVYPAINAGISDYSTFREWIKTRRL